MWSLVWAREFNSLSVYSSNPSAVFTSCSPTMDTTTDLCHWPLAGEPGAGYTIPSGQPTKGSIVEGSAVVLTLATSCEGQSAESSLQVGCWITMPPPQKQYRLLVQSSYQVSLWELFHSCAMVISRLASENLAWEFKCSILAALRDTAY